MYELAWVIFSQSKIYSTICIRCFPRVGIFSINHTTSSLDIIAMVKFNLLYKNAILKLPNISLSSYDYVLLVNSYVHNKHRHYIKLHRKVVCKALRSFYEGVVCLLKDIRVWWSANSLPLGYSLLVNYRYVKFCCFARENLPWDNTVKRQYHRITFSLYNFNARELLFKQEYKMLFGILREAIRCFSLFIKKGCVFYIIDNLILKFSTYKCVRLLYSNLLAIFSVFLSANLMEL